MSVLHAALFVWIAAVGCVANNAYRPSCRKVPVYERVSCGYPGISKKDCLKDCHCCFDDNAYKSKSQCFFRDPPPAQDLCCDAKRRVPCRLKGKDLEKDPYTCRQLGCCYDGSGGGRRRRRGRRGRHRRRRKSSYGYGSPPPDQPRCFKTRRNCCKRLIEHIVPSVRKMASYGSVSRRQCLLNRNACWDSRSKPQCFYKFKPCRCPVNSLKCKPCGRDSNQHRLDNNHSRCIAAGCCYRSAVSQTKCIRPRRRPRGRNAVDEKDYGMSDPDYDDYEYNDNDNVDMEERNDTENDVHVLENDVAAPEEVPDADERPKGQESNEQTENGHGKETQATGAENEEKAKDVEQDTENDFRDLGNDVAESEEISDEDEPPKGQESNEQTENGHWKETIVVGAENEEKAEEGAEEDTENDIHALRNDVAESEEVPDADDTPKGQESNEENKNGDRKEAQAAEAENEEKAEEGTEEDEDAENDFHAVRNGVAESEEVPDVDEPPKGQESNEQTENGKEAQAAEAENERKADEEAREDEEDVTAVEEEEEEETEPIIEAEVRHFVQQEGSEENSETPEKISKADVRIVKLDESDSKDVDETAKALGSESEDIAAIVPSKAVAARIGSVLKSLNVAQQPDWARRVQ